MYSPSHEGLADICVPNLERYAKRHGYELRTIHIENDKYHYKKHEAFKEWMDKDECDVIFYCDVDTLIMNHEYRVEDFINGDDFFYITADPNGLNGGVVIFRNGMRGKIFNDFVLEQRFNYENEQNVYDAFREHKNVGRMISVKPHPSFNQYDYSLYIECKDRMGREDLGDWQPGNFLIHFPALSPGNKIAMMQEYSKKIIE